MVVVKNNLGKVDVCYGLQQHLKMLYPYVLLGIVFKAFKAFVDLNILFVGREETFRFKECTCVTRCVITACYHCLVGICRNVFEGGGLVKVQTLYTVEGSYVVPRKEVPESPVVLALEGVAFDGVGNHLGVRTCRVVVGVVTTQVEDSRFCVSDITENLVVD